MSTVYNVLAWSPVLIGFMFSTSMYGVTLGQSIYYTYWFPDDSSLHKILVLWVFLGDTVHLIGSNLPWGGLAMTCLNTILAFTVQFFYCHRIWTISGKNKLLTLITFLSALSELVSGTLYNIDVARVGTVQYLFQCPLILPIACTGIVCDILITFSIFKYMWRSGFRRQRSIIRDLAVVCVNMGAFTCLISIITGIMFLFQGDGYWVASVGMLISQGYANSMMAVLNARKVIRDRDANIVELPSLSTM